MAKKKIHPAEQYAHDVLSGKILACEYVKLACKRYFNDRETGEQRGIYFNENKALRIINFFKFVKHSKGEWAGQQFELEPWQQFSLWNIFGFENADGTRRYNYAYIEVPKKNGKTTWMAGIANYLFIADGEDGAEIYSAALNRPQAKKCFNEAQSMIRKSPALSKRVTVYTHNMHILSTESKFEPLTSDEDSQEGINPHGAIIDEYHVHKNTGIYDTIKSAMGSRRNPIILIITTAGFDKNKPCFTERKKVIQILEGSIIQDNYFGIIYTADEGDNWEDETTWQKCNPNYGKSVKPTYIKKEYIDAKNSPTKLVNFLTKNLNIWTDAQEIWIKDKDWVASGSPFELESLKRMECYGGLDLSSVSDITSLCLLFPLGDEQFKALWYFWLPELTAEDRKKYVNYHVWKEQGYITFTEGNVIDYDWIYADVTGFTTNGDKAKKPGIVDLFDLKSIAYDRYNSSQIVINLQQAGVELSPFGQGFVSMNTPTQGIEKLILQKKLNHGSNPVMRWMCSNVSIEKDAAGNMKINKKKSSEKVDGMVSLVMAYGEYLTALAENKGGSQMFFI